MRFGSICSGIEAASVAWNPLGWETAFMSEIEKFPRAGLQHHYPDTPLHGDFTTIKGDEYGPIDLLCGGTPCQSFSVAGLRGGLDDERGNLSLEFIRLAARTRPRWLVWENVPGVLSSNGGRDFGAILGAFRELGYGWAYRVLDAQFIRVDGYARAVPQRRRRVVLVGHFGDWRRAAAVLFERTCLQGNPPPRREAGQAAAGTLGGSSQGGGGLGTDTEIDGGLVPEVLSTLAEAGGNARPGDTVQSANQLVPEVARTVTVGENYRQDFETTTMLPVAFAETRLCGGDGQVSSQLTTGGGKPGQGLPAVAVPLRAQHSITENGEGQDTLLHQGHRVRRLTPRECERLMGFPDDYTRIPYRGKPADQCPDGPRYKALGNSWAVNVFRWVGQRIDMVDKLKAQQEEAA